MVVMAISSMSGMVIRLYHAVMLRPMRLRVRFTRTTSVAPKANASTVVSAIAMLT